MNTIKLKVTSKVINQIDKEKNQEQIAITYASTPIKSAISSATKEKKIEVIVAGAINLTIGDTNAIWKAHNEHDFDNLFNLLYNYPDKEMEFPCTLK